MLEHVLLYLSQQRQQSVIAGGLLLVAVLGVIDCLTGYEISFALFYLAPIILVAWFTGRPAGMAIAVSSAFMWLLADLASGHAFTHALIPLWNAAMRFGFFAITVLLLSKLRRAYAEQASLITELQTALDQIKVLRGVIPICSWCKKICDEQGHWQQEVYVPTHAEASFLHTICPACTQQLGQESRSLA
jgi:hypothetical protein